jgi:hypothetical protein
MSAAPVMLIGDEPMRDIIRNDEGGKATEGSAQPSAEGFGEHPDGKNSTTKVVPSYSEV